MTFERFRGISILLCEKKRTGQVTLNGVFEMIHSNEPIPAPGVSNNLSFQICDRTGMTTGSSKIALWLCLNGNVPLLPGLTRTTVLDA